MRSAVALTVANVLAGLLNYLFQVHAAAVLDASAFGVLSAWLVQITVAMAPSTVVQFVSLERPIDDARFRTVVRACAVASALVLVGYALSGGRTPQLRLITSAGAVVGPLVLSVIVGQLQAKLRLGAAAAALLAMAAVRFGLPFLWARDERAPAFFVAHAAMGFAAVVAVAIVLEVSGNADAKAKAKAKANAKANADGNGNADANGAGALVRLGRPVLLAVATLVFPIVDVLVVSTVHDAATTGAFTRIGLAARIVFFGGAAALPVLLPHHMHVAKTGDALPAFIVRIERWLAPVLVAGAVVLAVLAGRFVLHPTASERVWLFATCVSAALLIAILGHVQRFAAQAYLGRAAACAAGVLLTRVAGAAIAAASAGAGGGRVGTFVLVCLAGDVVVFAAARITQVPFTTAEA